MIESQIMEEEQSLKEVKSLLRLADPSVLRHLEGKIPQKERDTTPMEELHPEMIGGKEEETVATKDADQIYGEGEEMTPSVEKKEEIREDSKEETHGTLHPREKKRRKVVERYHTVEWFPPRGKI
jgi:hypothetical protein